MAGALPKPEVSGLPQATALGCGLQIQSADSDVDLWWILSPSYQAMPGKSSSLVLP
jgi:hypothetical protein